MRAFTMFQADAFTSTLFKGNPAAVLVLDHALGDDDMLAIAAENNLAETAFVERQGSGWTIRWFTPAHEAAFCGHATLASAHVLATAYGVSGPISFSTRSVGQLTVSPSGDGGYDLDLPVVAAHDLAPSPVLADLFPDGWADSFRSFENIFIVLPSPEEVQRFQPDMSRIADLAPFGLGITAAGGRTHDGAPVDFVSRYFAPAAGIPEDPVTGSAHASLVPYWARHLGRTELSAFQTSGRGGYLKCRLAGDRVILTGHAVTYLRGTIYLPEAKPEQISKRA